MAIKNFWSFHPGETIVAEELQKRIGKLASLYFPLRDTGIDLLAISDDGKKKATFQIKESRYFENGNSTWHQETLKNIKRNRGRIDFYIFVFYLPGYLVPKAAKSSFVIRFVIVPMNELLRRIEYKRANKNGTFDFYFRISGDNDLLEAREKKETLSKNRGVFDYSEFLDNWSLVRKRFE